MQQSQCSKSRSVTAIGSGGWICQKDDGRIGPFSSKDEAEKDARETLGIAEDGEGRERKIE
jgi:hypothetical protein